MLYDAGRCSIPPFPAGRAATLGRHPPALTSGFLFFQGPMAVWSWGKVLSCSGVAAWRGGVGGMTYEV